MTELEARIVLNMLPDIGSIRFKKLLEYFKTAKAALRAGRRDLMACGIPARIAENFQSNINAVNLKKELQLIEDCRVKVIFPDSPDYPKLLKEIFDPPQVLYVKGHLAQEAINIAVIGSRQASFYGLKMAERFSYELASLGITVVSGLARGVDSASHRGALKAKGNTVAVLGSGLNCIYPPENKKLFEEIVDSGALISEFAMDAAPVARNFPRRNRIISGISCAVLVVEAARRSGALITANLALEQGRDVFAIPGHADCPTSWGTNQLIKEGAKLVDDVSEIISELNINVVTRPKSLETVAALNTNPALDSDEASILKAITDEPSTFDDIALNCRIPIAKFLSCLTKLEIKGLIKQLPGKRFILNSPQNQEKEHNGT